MGDESWWGLMLMIYIIPFAIWQMLSYDTLMIREKLFPGRSQIQLMGFNLDYISLSWSAGLAILLLFWKLGAPPIVGFIYLAVIGAFVYGVYRLALYLRENKIFAKPKLRIWLALSITWMCGVLAYFLIFESTSRMDGEEFFLLGLLPPLVLAVGIFTIGWAKRTDP